LKIAHRGVMMCIAIMVDSLRIRCLARTFHTICISLQQAEALEKCTLPLETTQFTALFTCCNRLNLLPYGEVNEQQHTSGSAAGCAQAEQNKQATGILVFIATIQIRSLKLVFSNQLPILCCLRMYVRRFCRSWFDMMNVNYTGNLNDAGLHY